MSPPRAGSTAGTEAVKKERNGNPESLHQPNGRSADFLLLDVSSSFRNARQQALHRPGSGGVVSGLFFLLREEDGSSRPRRNQRPGSFQTLLPKKGSKRGRAVV